MGELKAPAGRVIVRVDMQSKNWHTFSFGMRIRHERGPNNLNYRETQPVQGEVLDSRYIPQGSAVAFQHNAAHDYHRIFNYKPLSGSDIASEIRYFSIPEEACYLYRPPGGDRWLPLEGFATGLRVFKPYKGLIQGIEPQCIKDHLYVTSGHLKGQVVQTLRACDYQIVCMGLDGQEENIIRFRHWETPRKSGDDREEVILVNSQMSDQILNGEIYVGLTPTDAQAIDRVYDSERREFDDEYGQWQK